MVSGARVLGEMAGVEAGIGGAGEPEWDCGPLVAETLKHYASLGDVQMAVTCFIVLRDRIKVQYFVVYHCVCAVLYKILYSISALFV